MQLPSEQPRSDATFRRSPALFAGLAGLAACAAAWPFWPEAVLRGYLVAHQFWLGIALGSLVLLMIHHLTSGRWSLLLRGVLEAAMLTLPLMALLFLPVLLQLDRLYVWARPEAVAESHHLQMKDAYLDVEFFLGRTAVYFAVWILLAWRLRVWSRRQDEEPNPRITSRLARLSGPGLVLYGLTVTFASTDWVMSLQPIWYSTIFCMIYAMLQLISGLAFGIAALVMLRHREPLAGALSPQHFRSLGNLLLAMVML